MRYRIDNQHQDRTLDEAQRAEDDDLREHVGNDAQVDGALAPVDGRFLDNLARAVDAAKHHRGEGHDKQVLLRIKTRFGLNELLQRLRLTTILRGEGLTLRVVVQEVHDITTVACVSTRRAGNVDTRTGRVQNTTGHVIRVKGSPTTTGEHEEQDQGDDRGLQEQNQQVAHVIPEQFDIAPGEQRELPPGIATLGLNDLGSLHLAIGLRRRAALQGRNHILLELWRGF